jgi:S1-C subfamily serine protease
MMGWYGNDDHDQLFKYGDDIEHDVNSDNHNDHLHDLPDIQPADESRRDRLTGFLIGIGMALVTLVMVAAMLFTLIDSFALSGTHTPRQTANQVAPPSASDLVNAHYRPSGWTAPVEQIITPTPVAPQIVTEADAENLMLINIYGRVNPSVVNIEIVSRVHAASDIIDSSGSGFVLDLNGHIGTNAHVVRDAEEILVTFYDGYVSSADLVGYDDYSDLAVIRVDPAHAPLVPVEMGDSNDLQVGQRVITIGNPFGLDGSMTVGIVSALGRTLPSAQLLDPTYQQYSNPSIIQIDASVNPGNSGGPLLDSFGHVVGINTAIRTDTGIFEGIAFAVPINTAKRVMPQIINNGKVEYSWLGISSPDTSGGLSVAALADQLGFPVHNGVLISEVAPDSPAAHAGLRAGTETARVRGADIPTNSDIIVAINQQLVRDIDDLVAYLVENTSPGDKVVLTIVRSGQTLDLDVTLGVRP